MVNLYGPKLNFWAQLGSKHNCPIKYLCKNLCFGVYIPSVPSQNQKGEEKEDRLFPNFMVEYELGLLVATKRVFKQ